MKDENKTKEQLIEELAELRRRNTELEESVIRQKKSVEALQERNEYLEILCEYAPDAYYLNDQMGIFVDINRSNLKIACKVNGNGVTHHATTENNYFFHSLLKSLIYCI